jgi:hypothetical protein
MPGAGAEGAGPPVDVAALRHKVNVLRANFSNSSFSEVVNDAIDFRRLKGRLAVYQLLSLQLLDLQKAIDALDAADAGYAANAQKLEHQFYWILKTVKAEADHHRDHGGYQRRQNHVYADLIRVLYRDHCKRSGEGMGVDAFIADFPATPAGYEDSFDAVLPQQQIRMAMAASYGPRDEERFYRGLCEDLLTPADDADTPTPLSVFMALNLYFRSPTSEYARQSQNELYAAIQGFIQAGDPRNDLVAQLKKHCAQGSDDDDDGAQAEAKGVFADLDLDDSEQAQIVRACMELLADCEGSQIASLNAFNRALEDKLNPLLTGAVTKKQNRLKVRLIDFCYEWVLSNSPTLAKKTAFRRRYKLLQRKVSKLLDVLFPFSRYGFLRFLYSVFGIEAHGKKNAYRDAVAKGKSKDKVPRVDPADVEINIVLKMDNIYDHYSKRMRSDFRRNREAILRLFASYEFDDAADADAKYVAACVQMIIQWDIKSRHRNLFELCLKNLIKHVALLDAFDEYEGIYVASGASASDDFGIKTNEQKALLLYAVYMFELKTNSISDEFSQLCDMLKEQKIDLLTQANGFGKNIQSIIKKHNKLASELVSTNTVDLDAYQRAVGFDLGDYKGGSKAEADETPEIFGDDDGAVKKSIRRLSMTPSKAAIARMRGAASAEAHSQEHAFIQGYRGQLLELKKQVFERGCDNTKAFYRLLNKQLTQFMALAQVGSTGLVELRRPVTRNLKAIKFGGPLFSVFQYAEGEELFNRLYNLEHCFGHDKDRDTFINTLTLLLTATYQKALGKVKPAHLHQLALALSRFVIAVAAMEASEDDADHRDQALLKIYQAFIDMKLSSFDDLLRFFSREAYELKIKTIDGSEVKVVEFLHQHRRARLDFDVPDAEEEAPPSFADAAVDALTIFRERTKAHEGRIETLEDEIVALREQLQSERSDKAALEARVAMLEREKEVVAPGKASAGFSPGTPDPASVGIGRKGGKRFSMAPQEPVRSPLRRDSSLLSLSFFTPKRGAPDAAEPPGTPMVDESQVGDTYQEMERAREMAQAYSELISKMRNHIKASREPGHELHALHRQLTGLLQNPLGNRRLLRAPTQSSVKAVREVLTPKAHAYNAQLANVKAQLAAARAESPMELEPSGFGKAAGQDAVDDMLDAIDAYHEKLEGVLSLTPEKPLRLEREASRPQSMLFVQRNLADMFDASEGGVGLGGYGGHDSSGHRSSTDLSVADL